MADLEAAADRALVKVTELKEHVHETEQALVSLDEESSRWAERLDEEAEGLREQARRLQARVEEEQERLEREVDESLRALDAVEEAARLATDECDRAAGDTRGEIVELQEAARECEGRVAASGRSLEAMLAEFGRRVAEVERDLEVSMGDAVALARAMDARLQELSASLAEHSLAVQQVLDEECPARIDAARSSFEAGLDHFDQALSADLEALEPPTQATCENACAVSARAVGEEYPEFEQQAAGQGLSDLGLAALAHESELLADQTNLSAKSERQLEHAQTAVDALDSMMEELASHGYV